MSKSPLISYKLVSDPTDVPQKIKRKTTATTITRMMMMMTTTMMTIRWVC